MSTVIAPATAPSTAAAPTSVKAYLHALNKIMAPAERTHPQL